MSWAGDDLVDGTHRLIDRNREAKSDRAARRLTIKASNGAVNSDESSTGISQCSARVPWVNCRIGLNRIDIRLGIRGIALCGDWAIERRNNSCGNCCLLYTSDAADE